MYCSDQFLLELIPGCHLSVQTECVDNHAFHVIISTIPSVLPRKASQQTMSLEQRLCRQQLHMLKRGQVPCDISFIIDT